VPANAAPLTKRNATTNEATTRPGTLTDIS
jgi:hypothetical protein